MEQADATVGKLARLPDGSLVEIKIVYPDGYAKAKRLDGEWYGRIVFCAIEKLMRA